MDGARGVRMSMSSVSSRPPPSHGLLSVAVGPAIRWIATKLRFSREALPSPGEVATALAVGIAYYIGAELAFWIGTLSHLFAPFWPPNMILFCALLQANYRSWWLYVAAALPAHIAAETARGMGTDAWLGAFACNIALAVTAAVALRRLSSGPPWLDTLGKAWRFILVAAIGAPVLVAGAVAGLSWSSHNGLGSVEFAERWGLANFLGGIALAPLFVTWFGEGLGWLVEASARRAAEAGVLAIALAAAAYIGFPAAAASYPVVACLPIPLMIWAAVRFGPRGASGAILVVSIMALDGAIAGRAPFAASSSDHTILSLQMFLAVLSAPFLVLAAIVVERQQATADVHELSARLLQAQDEERRRIARELHDGMGQSLAAAGLTIRGLARSGALPPSARGAVEDTIGLLDEMQCQIRTLSYLLHPPLLDEVGLAPALTWYVGGFAKRSGIAIALSIAPEIGRLDADVEVALFRTVQECLTNVHRHSGSKTAKISLERAPAALVLTVSDAGRGMGEAAGEPGHSLRSLGVGIAGMRARLKQLGGRLDIRSSPGGSAVTATVPSPASKRGPSGP